MDGRWASLGRGNPGGPESIGNNLGLGFDGPRIQLCSNVTSTRNVAIEWCRSQMASSELLRALKKSLFWPNYFKS